MAKVNEQFKIEGDQIVHVTTHDWNPMLERVKELKAQGIDGFSENKLVGVIDAALLGQILKQKGVKWNDTQAVEDILKQIMMSGDFKNLRVWEGSY